MANNSYASFWSRILAGIIDGLIYMPIELLRMKYASHDLRIILIDNILLGILYIFFWLKYAATPGMMVMRIRLIVKEGSRFTVIRAIVRYIGLQISAITIIGGLWMLWDRRKQMWHDKMAGTYVIKVDS